MNSVIFKTKNGELYEAYSIDHKSKLIGGYRLFSGYAQSNPFRVFKTDEVLIERLDRAPQEEVLSIYGKEGAA